MMIDEQRTAAVAAVLFAASGPVPDLYSRYSTLIVTIRLLNYSRFFRICIG